MKKPTTAREYIDRLKAQAIQRRESAKAKRESRVADEIAALWRMWDAS